MPLAQPSGGLEELVDETSGKEIVATPVVINRFEELTKKYEQYLNEADANQTTLQIPSVLTPTECNTFLQSTNNYENHARYQGRTGLFVSKLIQCSYDAGYNDFKLDMNTLKSVDYLAYEISGTKKRMLKVVIKGEVEYNCGYGAKHSTLTIEKAGDGCGHGAQYSTFIIEEVGDACGYGVQYSTFTIGKAEGWCGIGAEHSIFKTYNREQYRQFKKFVDRRSANSVYLLSPNGSILKGGKW